MKPRELIEHTGENSVALGQVFSVRDYTVRDWKIGRVKIPDNIFIDLMGLAIHRKRIADRYKKQL